MERVPDVSPELPPRVWRLFLAMLGRLPERALSRSFGRVADLPIPSGMRARVLALFARSVGIDLSEVELPLERYPTLNEFFVRRLRSGARSWPSDSLALASPVDGIVGRFGAIVAGTAIQAKGHSYSIADLLDDSAEAARYEGGSFATIYLSPRHYHRIHTPAAGSIEAATYVPGSLLPVNAPAVMHVPHLFARNERLICHILGGAGRIAVVAIGAYNVGRISAAFDPAWSGEGAVGSITNRRQEIDRRKVYDPAIRVGSGDEIMAFHLGSTVVLLLERSFELRGLEYGAEIRVGSPIGGG